MQSFAEATGEKFTPASPRLPSRLAPTLLRGGLAPRQDKPPSAGAQMGRVDYPVYKPL